MPRGKPEEGQSLALLKDSVKVAAIKDFYVSQVQVPSVPEIKLAMEQLGFKIGRDSIYKTIELLNLEQVRKAVQERRLSRKIQDITNKEDLKSISKSLNLLKIEGRFVNLLNYLTEKPFNGGRNNLNIRDISKLADVIVRLREQRLREARFVMEFSNDSPVIKTEMVNMLGDLDSQDEATSSKSTSSDESTSSDKATSSDEATSSSEAKPSDNDELISNL